MKKLFLLGIVVMVTAISAVAQEKETAPAKKDAKPTTEQKDVKPATSDQVKPDHIDWDKKIKDDLKLTNEQSEKYDALNKEYREKIDAVLKDASLDKDAQKEKKMNLKKEKEGKFLEILTPEQQTKFKELKESWEKKNSSKSGS